MGLFFKEESWDLQVVDIHTHILPGIDDGSSSWQESPDMATLAYKNGVRSIVVTPHNKEYKASASPEDILMLVKKLQDVLDRCEINIKIYPGNEIMRSASIEDLTENKYLEMNDSSYVLVEFKPGDPAKLLINQLNNIIRAGNKVILAHPERYECLIEDFSLVKQIIDMGVLIQINTNSVISKSNSKVYKFVRQMLKNKYVHFIASDMHDSKVRTPNFKECIECLLKITDKEYIEELLYKNANKYLGVSV